MSEIPLEDIQEQDSVVDVDQSPLQASKDLTYADVVDQIFARCAGDVPAGSDGFGGYLEEVRRRLENDERTARQKRIGHRVGAILVITSIAIASFISYRAGYDAGQDAKDVAVEYQVGANGADKIAGATPALPAISADSLEALLTATATLTVDPTASATPTAVFTPEPTPEPVATIPPVPIGVVGVNGATIVNDNHETVFAALAKSFKPVGITQDGMFLLAEFPELGLAGPYWIRVDDGISLNTEGLQIVEGTDALLAITTPEAEVAPATEFPAATPEAIPTASPVTAPTPQPAPTLDPNAAGNKYDPNSANNV